MVLLGLRRAALRWLVAELLHRQAWHVFLRGPGRKTQRSRERSVRGATPNFASLYDNPLGGKQRTATNYGRNPTRIQRGAEGRTDAHAMGGVTGGAVKRGGAAFLEITKLHCCA